MQHRRLVGGEVEHAVAHDHIEAARLQGQGLEGFDRALQKRHIRVTELLGMEVQVLAGHRQLLRRHVDSHHRAARPHQLGQGVDVPARAAAQIENVAALQQGRAHQAAAVVARQYVRVDAGQ